MNTQKLIYMTVRAAYDFKFHINPDEIINRLEIGQADY